MAAYFLKEVTQMSKAAPASLNCPFCGTAQEVILYDSVNVSVDPELKDAVLEQTINTFDCINCRKNVSVHKNLLYHDMDNKLLIYLLNQDSEAEAASTGNIFSSFFAYNKMRSVCSLNHLKEKILIFENGLNDYIIEIIKCAFAEKLADHIDHTDPIAFAAQNVFFCELAENEEQTGQDLAFIALNTNQGNLFIRQDFSFYAQIRASYGTELERIASLHDNKLKLVDTELASQIIGELVNG